MIRSDLGYEYVTVKALLTFAVCKIQSIGGGKVNSCKRRSSLSSSSLRSFKNPTCSSADS